MAKLRPDEAALAQLRRLADADATCVLIDGGATACLQTASPEELLLLTVAVQLAASECHLHTNPAGTLLSVSPVAPIV